VVSEPFSIAFDAAGTLYGVEFTKSNRIYKLDASKLSFIAGEQHSEKEAGAKEASDVRDGSDPMKALFNGMHDIQIAPDGRAIIGDSFHHLVRVLDIAKGHVSTLAGTGKPGFGGDGGPATAASFNITMTASLTPDGKGILIADIGNNRVRRIDLATGKVATVAGNGKKGNPADGSKALEAPLGDARAVTQAVDGTLYVLLRGGNSLVEVKNGKVRTVVNASGKKGYSGDGGLGREATMNGPKYVAMDPQSRVLICDTENHCVRRYDPTTQKVELLAGQPPKNGTKLGATWSQISLSRPHGVRMSIDGKTLYICDTYNNRVLRGEYR
jgi:sugar lactone lactonase YvrE